jgi:hypothetical protein
MKAKWWETSSLHHTHRTRGCADLSLSVPRRTEISRDLDIAGLGGGLTCSIMLAWRETHGYIMLTAVEQVDPVLCGQPPLGGFLPQLLAELLGGIQEGTDRLATFLRRA